MVKPKIRIIACADNFHFIQDLIPSLSDEFDIKTIRLHRELSAVEWDDINTDMKSSDLLWLEWADGGSLEILKRSWLEVGYENVKIILRLHRYELFTPRTLENFACRLHAQSIGRINKLVFVSRTVQDIGVEKFPWMSNSVVVPNLIDHTKFPFTDREQGFNLMMLGRMSYVKNLPLALNMFHELAKTGPYQLHIVGGMSDPEIEYYLENFIRKTIGFNIHYHGVIENNELSEFMKDMNYILCSSVFESFGMGILEAMCCGLKPVVFDFPGAENMFPKRWRWIDYEQLETIITGNYDPFIYNNFVYGRHSIENNINLYKDLIYGVLNENEKENHI